MTHSAAINASEKTLHIRMPEAKDGKDIHQLVQGTGVLDVNSEYAYVLLGEHFKETCAVVEKEGELVAFISAYIPPNQTDALFVWQIAVSKSQQKQGLGRAMLHEILKRKPCNNLSYIYATIAPSNKASRSLFTSFARELDTSFHEQSMFPSDYFSDQHENEPLFVIGPLLHQQKEEIV